MDVKSSEKRQYVVFRIDDEVYGADINKVTIIERLLNIARVPMTPLYMKGVINLRGEIIPVLSLRLKFALEEIPEDDDTRIVIFKVNEIAFGIIVDSVAEVIQMDDSQIESITNITNDRTLDYISGIGKSEDRLITLLNLEKIITEFLD